MLDTYKLMINRGIEQLSLPDEPAKLYDPIRYFLQIGGKRIRPILVLLAADLYGEDRVDEALPAALAVELFHNFTLIHDDIMDEAPLRRGMQTVHEKWDTNVAILSGDNLLILAYQQLAKVKATYALPLYSIFSRMAQEVCEGQQWDMEFENRHAISQEAYIEMIRLKTAVLLGTALQMGAIIGGATPEDASHLYDFGAAIGIAFQLQDDLLDVYGDPATFGKQVGGDILANKKTILLVHAYEQANDAQKQELLQWQAFHDHGDTAREEQKITAVRHLYNQLNVQVTATKLKEDYVSKAFSSLEKMSIDQQKLGKLRALAQHLLTRTR